LYADALISYLDFCSMLVV